MTICEVQNGKNTSLSDFIQCLRATVQIHYRVIMTKWASKARKSKTINYTYDDEMCCKFRFY